MDNARRACERPRVPLVLLLFGLFLGAHPAYAGEAAEIFARAEADDARGDFARALGGYEAAVASEPSAAFVPRATARAEILRTHAEGGFAPFARLERVRRDPRLASDPGEIDALARDAEAFPPGLVRAEARMLVAEAYVGRLGRPAEAPPILERVADDASTDPLTARLAVRMLVDAHLARGDVPGAIAAARARPSLLEPSLARQMAELARRSVAHRLAIGILVTMILLVGLAIARAARRRALDPLRVALRSSWRSVLVLAALVAGGGLLASTYEAGTSGPFVVLGIAFVPLALAARVWGAVGSDGALARAGRAALCAASVVATGLLVLEWIDSTYLGSFGL
jgi:hypothetical protein